MNQASDARTLRSRLRKIGLSQPVIDAAWPAWWSTEAEASPSARTELRFSLARKLGLDPHSLLEDTDEPRFIWYDRARFKNLSGESDVERAALASFGTVLAKILVAAAPEGRAITRTPADVLRQSLLGVDKPFVRLVDMLALCWSVGVPVIHLRVFPWPQKRMAAMTVRVGDRWAVLLGKDSMYPAHVAFYLAHEVAHIALDHVEADRLIVDLEQDRLHVEGDDVEESLADAYALELLTGEPRPIVLPSGTRYSAGELARVALESGPQLRIEPGTLALCFGYSTGDWATANAAIQRIYESAKPAWREINGLAKSQLDMDLIPDDYVDFVSAVLGDLPTP